MAYSYGWLVATIQASTSLECVHCVVSSGRLLKGTLQFRLRRRKNPRQKPTQSHYNIKNLIKQNSFVSAYRHHISYQTKCTKKSFVSAYRHHILKKLVALLGFFAIPSMYKCM